VPTSSPRTCPAFMPLALMVLALLAPALRAQPSAADDPASRELLRQQERERLLRRQFEATPEVHIPRPPAEATDAGYPGTESPCFRIERIVLDGEHAQRFAWAIPAADRRPDGTQDPVAGRCLGAAGIGVAMRRIQNAVIARGFVTTRVLAPAQDLTRGELKLTVIAGRVGVLRPAAGSDPRATLRNAVPAATGDLLNLRAIEQGLPLVRVANTGISGVIDAKGRVVATLPLDTAGWKDVALPGALPPTPFVRLGERPALVLLFGVFLWGFWPRRRPAA